MQQSAAESKIPPQLLVPHTRFPAHSLSLSQSPSFSWQGLSTVQQSHVSSSNDPVQSHFSESKLDFIDTITKMQSQSKSEKILTLIMISMRGVKPFLIQY